MHLQRVCAAVICLIGTLAMSIDGEKTVPESLEAALPKEADEKQADAESIVNGGDKEGAMSEKKDAMFRISREYLDLGVKCITWKHQKAFGLIGGGMQPTLAIACPAMMNHIVKFESANEEAKKKMGKFFYKHRKMIYSAGACLNLNSTYDTLWETGAGMSDWGHYAYTEEASRLLNVCHMLFEDAEAATKEATKDFKGAEQQAGTGDGSRLKRALENMVDFAKVGYLHSHLRK